MDCPIHIGTISMSLSIKYFKGLLVMFGKIMFLSMKIVLLFIIANNADPDEMPSYAPDEMPVLQCLPKYMFTGIKNENGKGQIE